MEGRAIRQEQPGGNDEDTDQWNVGIAVGYDLHSHLHNSDNRHCGSQVPEPSRRNKGTPSSLYPGNPADDDDEQCAEQWLPDRESSPGMRIDQSQMKRPDGFPKVRPIGVQGSFEP